MDNSWDRIEEQRALWSHFEQGRNIAMFAPIKLGKSWLMKKVLLDADENWQGVSCNLEKATTSQQALATIIQEIIKAHNIKIQTDSENIIEEVFDTLDKADGKQTLICLDDFTLCATQIMRHSIDDGFLFLNTLHKIRETYSQVRWMMVGSNIEHFSKEYRVTGTLNDLHPFLIKAFTKEVANDFVTDFCQRHFQPTFNINLKTQQFLQKRIGWLSPYYLEKLCLQIRPFLESDVMPSMPVSAIKEAYEKLLTHPQNEVFSCWPTHLENTVSSRILPLCEAILTYLCGKHQGDSMAAIRKQFTSEYREEEIDESLLLLTNDAFLYQNNDDNYLFSMDLLADYWQDYFA